MLRRILNFSRFRKLPYRPIPSTPVDPRAKFLPYLSLSQYQGDWVSGGTRVTMSPEVLATYQTATPWFVYEADKMVFSGERTALSTTYNFRSELRHGPEWNPSGNNRMDFEVELGTTNLNEYTFAQIHRKETFATQPPMRLVWLKSRSSVLNNIYAVLRRETGKYEYFPLGVKPEGVFKVSFILNGLNLRVLINDVEKHNSNPTDWTGYNCYFKIGTYLTGSAAATGTIVAKYSSVTTSNSIINNIGFG